MPLFMSSRVALRISSTALLMASMAVPLTAQIKHPSLMATIERRDHIILLQNGFVQVSFDLAGHRILNLSADHTGEGHFSGNLLGTTGGVFGDTFAADALATCTLSSGTSGRKSLRARWSSGDALHTVEISLGAHDRGLHIVSRSSGPDNSVALSLRQWLIVGMFDRGVVQSVAGQTSHFSSQSPLRLLYTTDKSLGSIAVVPSKGKPLAESTLLSGSSASSSGLELRSRPSVGVHDQWSDTKEQGASLQGPSANVRAEDSGLDFTLFANDLPYPATRGADAVFGLGEGVHRDSDAILTATYSTAAAVLGSYQEPGSAYPTLAAPKRTYGDAFDFFDPDAWPVINTLSYSGDPLLQREARKILERSERGMLPDGQLPHHFEQGKPVYLSIAKSTQSGPNLFWVLAAVDYTSATGDEQWLRGHYPTMKKAAGWILAHFDSTQGLLNVDGPLFIDVFRRSGYTLDTNAMAIHLMEVMAESAEACDDLSSVRRYRDFATRLRAGLYRHLWDGHDHFITERHPNGTVRDFIDYDGNLAAVAFGALPSVDEEHAVLHRIDNNPLAHPGGRGTWVSERRYEKSDCYGENDGDSDVAMGRIWWLDMLSRVRVGDRATFDNTLQKIEGDLLQNAWMNERYDSTGKPAHSPYYHEYPEIVAMTLRELRYGVRLGPREVQIIPFGPRQFTIKLGALTVNYSRTEVILNIPGRTHRSFSIGGLLPNTPYRLNATRSLQSDPSGNLHFFARAGKPLHLKAVTRPSHPI